MSDKSQSNPDLYLPLYVGDFLRSTMEWTIQEKGAYLYLLSLQWANRSLPEAVKDIARMAGCSPQELKRLWPRLESKFPIGEGGRRQNLRLERHRELVVLEQERRVERARKAAEARWIPDATQDARALPEHMLEQCNPKPNPKPKPTLPEHWKEASPIQAIDKHLPTSRGAGHDRG